MPLYHRTRFITVEVAGDGENRVVRCVVRREEVGDIIQACRVKIRYRPDERVVKWVIARKRERGQTLLSGSVWLIVYRSALFVLHDIALRIELLLRHGG